MKTFIKTVIWALVTIIVIVIGSLFVGFIASTVLQPVQTESVSQPDTITFTKLSNNDNRINQGKYFILTKNDLENYSSLITSLNWFVVNSSVSWFNFGTANNTQFNTLANFFLTKSHRLSIFSYDNTFIEYKINYS